MTTLNDRISVVLADDHRILREALRAVLASACDVVGEAARGDEAVALIVELLARPDVAAMGTSEPLSRSR